MEINFTKNQNKSILSNKKFIVVNSSAGTGKTTILVERVLNLLFKGEEIKRIIVLTFTNNVAKEIMNRLWHKLHSIINNKNSHLNNSQIKHLKKQLFELPNSYILTFHSFCKRALEENIFNTKDLKIINELEFSKILSNCSKKIIKKWMNNERNYPILYKLTRLHDTKFLQIIKTLYKQALYRGEKFKDFMKYNLDLYENPEILDHSNCLKETILIDNSIVNLAPKKFLIEIEKSILFAYHYYYINNFIIKNKLVVYGKIIKKQLSLNALWEKFNKLEFKKNKDNWVNDFRKNLWTCYKFVLLNKSKMEKDFLFFEKLSTLYYVKENNYFQMNDILKKEYKFIYKLIIEINNEITKEMKKLNLYSFDDLIYLFWDNFKSKNEGNSLHDTLVNNFNHILIDEFQDTSIYQYNFIKLLEKDEINIFIVGDSKQSIYRFQGAIPSLFEEVRQKAIKRNDGEVIPLRDNFRSNLNIINFTNLVFSFLYEKIGLGSQFRYEKEDHLICTKQNTKTNLSIQELYYDKNKLFSNKDEQINALATTFFDIKQLIKKSGGKLKYSDFMILTRNNFKFKNIKYVSNIFNIPIRGRYKQLVLKEYSFYTIFYHMIRTIFSPHDDISLLSTLKYLFDINDSDLIDIKIHYHKTNQTKSPYLDRSFFTILKNFILNQKDNQELKIKVVYFLNTLNSIQEYFRGNSLMNSIKYFLFKLDLFKKMSSYQSIEESMKWWEIIIKKLHSISPLNKSLKDFIDILDEGDLNNRSEIDFNTIQKENSVFIMTIHSAKGLEAKYVYYLHSSNILNNNKNVDESIGINTVFESEIKGKKIKTPQQIFINEKEKLLTIYDTLRLFYVICTRAKENLVFVRKKMKLSSKCKVLDNIFSFNSIDDLLYMISNQKFYQNLINNKEIDYELVKNSLCKNYENVDKAKMKRKYQCIAPFLQKQNLIKQKDNKKYSNKMKLENSSSIIFGLHIHKIIEIILKQLIISRNKNNNFKELVNKFFKSFLEELKIIEDEKYIKILKKYSLSFFFTKEFKKWFQNKESKFYSEVPIYINKKTNEEGRIDLLIIMNQNAIIVDFKTDKLENKKDFIIKHKKQLLEYANSLKTHYHTINLFIYSTHLNQFININL